MKIDDYRSRFQSDGVDSREINKLPQLITESWPFKPFEILIEKPPLSFHLKISNG